MNGFCGEGMFPSSSADPNAIKSFPRYILEMPSDIFATLHRDSVARK